MWAEAADPVAVEPGAEADASNPTGDVADTGEVANIGPGVGHPDQPPVPAPPPARPSIQRNTMQPAPPVPDPPMPRQQYQQQQQQQSSYTAVEAAPTDSLSLQQLRRLVAEQHHQEPLAYDFEYSDMGPHAEEIDEWFSYNFREWVRLSSAQRAFEWHWDNEGGGAGEATGEGSGSGTAWDDADNDTRTRFIRAAIAGVQSNDAALRSASIGKLVYLVLGRWGDTAMPNATPGDSRSAASISQLQAIKAGVECLTSLEGLPVVWEALRNNFELHW